MFGSSSRPSKPTQNSSQTLAASVGAAPRAQTSASEKGIKVEEKGVYMILWNTGYPGRYHWGLLVAMSKVSEILLLQALSGTEWKLVIENKNVEHSKTLLVALKLGVVEDISDEWFKHIKQCVRAAKVEGEELTCRTWALVALYELASKGFIGILADWRGVRKIEQEAKDQAELALSRREPMVAFSQASAR